MLKPFLVAVGVLVASVAHADPIDVAPGIRLVSGSNAAGRQPDGNSILIDAPQGLILVDTGRHRAHQEAILAFARLRGKPIAAIINTHWHLDHSGGNEEIRAAFPAAPLYASNAVDGALRGFLRTSRADAEAYLRSGKASPEIAEDIALDMAAIDNPGALRPSIPVTGSTSTGIGGRKLELNLAPFAATEGDVWLYDHRSRVLIAGDLVVAAAPYLDTACPEGWRKALDSIAARNFRILVPGHGAPMNKPQFLKWRRAFTNLLDCAASNAANAACIAGWRRDASVFIPAEKNTDGLIAYYLETRLRAAPDERQRYCKPQ
ncbi:MBL fold metallo-hydrolase [Aquisediminimonas profunda]|uniref:MBL fold metallo-hydrolase n=1 Tax=Aquisediminimonas profunda TaxID=1550733 RepID=UPI001C62DBA4|nr:MBL fold metallo-hydrolase [Aquisediminimonas profunda]